ncbi:zinc ribbon domain-containing protein [Spirulina sp. CS-785/01]|nr:zinc ribbon domain-containing protein [Spirulina sp. CS-785/01]MDB9314204.1 zinc ribbon domain-containing protein [Spirulina sp. CS-785/01]
MLDGGFGQFREILKWVCWKRGKYFGQVDHKYTSQICPNCGTHTGKKELSERSHVCAECGYETTRERYVLRTRYANGKKPASYSKSRSWE